MKLQKLNIPVQLSIPIAVIYTVNISKNKKDRINNLVQIPLQNPQV